jgi:hypothetical protein
MNKTTINIVTCGIMPDSQHSNTTLVIRRQSRAAISIMNLSIEVLRIKSLCITILSIMTSA